MMRKQMLLLLVVFLILSQVNLAQAQRGEGLRVPKCPVGVPYRREDCYPVEQLEVTLSLYGSGIDTISFWWYRIKTARSYVLEEYVQGKWRVVAQIASRERTYRHRVGCGVKRSFRMYAKDGAYRSKYSITVTANTFACQ